MKYELLPFQSSAVPLMGEQNFLLADDCGLGKTLTAVECARRYARGPVLIIAPRLTKEWWAEVIRDQEAGYVGVCGQAGRGVPWRKVATWGNKKPNIYVVVHPTAVRMSADKLRAVKWDMVIVDEAHRFKNRKAKQTKALKTLIARRKIMLTATPYGRSPADMWALLHWLYPKSFRSYWRFFDQYVDSYRPPHGRFTTINGPKNLKQLAKEIEPFYLKRTKEQVLPDLPPITYSDVPIVLEGKQEQLYLKLVKDAYAELSGTEIILENALVRFLRLQQCALDPSIISEDLPPYPLGEVPAKVQWLQEWIEDHPGESVVIVSRYRRFVEAWLRGLAPGACIVGGMDRDEVQSALKVFNKTGVMVGSLHAIKEGLNLQRASTMIITDGSWSSTDEYQLSQRIYRVGQTRHCHVIHLVAKLSQRRKWTVDKLMRRAVEKRFNDAQLVDEFVRDLKGSWFDQLLGG